MTRHSAHLHSHRWTRTRSHRVDIPNNSWGRLVVPCTTCHVVASTKENIGQVWRPGDLADGVVMPNHHGLWALLRGTDIKGADRPIHARGGQDRRSIFIPVMCQSFGRRTGGRWNARFTRNRRYRGCMDRNLESEVVGGGCRGAKVEQTDVRVGGNTGKDVG